MIHHLRVALAGATLFCIQAGSVVAGTLTMTIEGCDNPTWNNSTNPPSIVCQAVTPSGPPSCSSLVSTTNTPLPGASFTLTATCSAATGSPITAYQFYTNSANPDDNVSPNFSQTNAVGVAASPNQISLLAPAVAGDSRTYYARAQNANGWSTSSPSRTVTATNAPAVSAPTGCEITPTSVALTTGQSQNFSVSCGSSEVNPSFSWTYNGGNPTTAATTRGFGVNYPVAGTNFSVSATVCNEGTACAAPVSRSVTVTAPTGSGEFPSCPDFRSTAYIPSASVLQTAVASTKTYYTNEYTNFDGTTALIYAFRTPSSPTTRLVFNLAEYGGSPTGRAAFLGTSACIKRGSAGVIAESFGNTVTLKASVGVDSAYGYPRLELNTVYYVSVYNRDSNGNNTCLLENCPGLSYIQLR